ncbi:alpha/beta fold hydrolase [Streptomyces sp. NPDC005969]|uniref:alpha/beta fold hydrolase n=1 Tax=Streptomyces sp. NPDC005969 TaxID=3156722 RepID=UPI0033DBA322
MATRPLSATRHCTSSGPASGAGAPVRRGGPPRGHPAVLVHGYVDSWRTFEPLLRHLPPSLHVYAPTQRGHGDAAKPPGGYLPEDFAADLLAFMDSVGIGRAVLVGGSSGGVQARIVAARHPDRVAGRCHVVGCVRA